MKPETYNTTIPLQLSEDYAIDQFIDYGYHNDQVREHLKKAFQEGFKQGLKHNK